MSDYKTGSIVYLSEKGFGFITSEQLESNSYFHANKVKGIPFINLKIGDNVQFKDTKNARGIELVDVAIIS